MTLPGAKDVTRAADTLAARIPGPLAPLARLAFNYRWAWEPGGADVFRAVEPARFDRLRGNPVRLLREAPVDRLERAAGDRRLVERAEALEQRLRADLDGAAEASEPPVAFFCAEFGVHPSLQIYSGGLGVLAADLLKEASDRRVPMVGVGVLYSTAIHQRLDWSGWQHDYFTPVDPELLPAALVTEEGGTALTVRVPIRGRAVVAQVWRVDIGRTPLYLLDANRPENEVLDRWITTRLYTGDRKTRLAKYLLLGMGGMRALGAMGLAPSVIHLNEGHAAFAPLGLAADRVEAGRSFDEALEEARRRTVFTTHTPVPAGNETFSAEEVADVAGGLPEALGIEPDALLALGRMHPEDPGGDFGITTLGLRCARTANGVSRRHGVVARDMWRPLYSDRAPEDVPIGHVTNGVHLPTWMAGPMRGLLDRHLREGWESRAADPRTWEPVDDIPDAELWETRRRLRADLVSFLRERTPWDRLARGEPSDDVAADLDAFDPEALTLGFARRVAMYKRVYLLISDPERAERLLHGPPPMQVVLAGKAHHQDLEAKHALRSLFLLDRAPALAKRVAYLQDYEMGLASLLVAGCDVWINLPRPPMEASGTSGMKSALNGGLNLSVLDGWWEEAYDGTNGWAVEGGEAAEPEAQDAADAAAFYDLLEREVIPLFHDRDEHGIPVGWVRKVKSSLRTNGPRFVAGRMLGDYLEAAYRLPVS